MAGARPGLRPNNKSSPESPSRVRGMRQLAGYCRTSAVSDPPMGWATLIVGIEPDRGFSGVCGVTCAGSCVGGGGARPCLKRAISSGEGTRALRMMTGFGTTCGAGGVILGAGAAAGGVRAGGGVATVEALTGVDSFDGVVSVGVSPAGFTAAGELTTGAGGGFTTGGDSGTGFGVGTAVARVAVAGAASGVVAGAGSALGGSTAAATSSITGVVDADEFPEKSPQPMRPKMSTAAAAHTGQPSAFEEDGRLKSVGLSRREIGVEGSSPSVSASSSPAHSLSKSETLPTLSMSSSRTLLPRRRVARSGPEVVAFMSPSYWARKSAGLGT